VIAQPRTDSSTVDWRGYSLRVVALVCSPGTPLAGAAGRGSAACSRLASTRTEATASRPNRMSPLVAQTNDIGATKTSATSRSNSSAKWARVGARAVGCQKPHVSRRSTPSPATAVVDAVMR
jgi:hypothetical protein